MVALVICNGSRRWKALDASVSCRSASVLFSSGDGTVSVFAGDCMGWWAWLSRRVRDAVMYSTSL